MPVLLSFFFGLFFQLPGHATPNSREFSITAKSLQEQSNQRYSYNFGSVRLYWSQYADFYLRNTDSQALPLRGVFITGSSYRAWSDCPRTLSPGKRCLTRVEFRPWTEGYFTGRLRFAFPDENIYVELFGWGLKN